MKITKKVLRRWEMALKRSIWNKWEPLASGEFVGKEEPRCACCDMAKEFSRDNIKENSCSYCPIAVLRTESTEGKVCIRGYYEWGRGVTPGGEGWQPNCPSAVAAAKEVLANLHKILHEVQKRLAKGKAK